MRSNIIIKSSQAATMTPKSIFCPSALHRNQYYYQLSCTLQEEEGEVAVSQTKCHHFHLHLLLLLQLGLSSEAIRTTNCPVRRRRNKKHIKARKNYCFNGCFYQFYVS